MFKFLKNIFATSKPFGLSISDQKVQIVQLSEKGKIQKYGEKKLASGLIQNGTIVDEKTLGHLIKTLKFELGIETKECAVCLPENLVFEHIFFLPPNLSEDEFIKKLNSLIEITIPIPLKDLKFSFKKLSLKNVQAAVVVATRKEIFQKYYLMLREYADLAPKVIESELFSLTRNLNVNLEGDFGSMILSKKGNKIQVGLIWNLEVFDSFCLSIPEEESEITQLLNSLDESVNNFQHKTKRPVKNLFFVGNSDLWVELMTQIREKTSFSPQIIDEFQIPLESYEKTVGIAMRALDLEKSRGINLLK